MKSTQISKPTSFLTSTVLVLLAVLCTFFISHFGDKAGYMLIIVIIGIAFSLLSILFPVFGFYLSIFISFFVFDIQRLFSVDLPLNSVIDLLVLATFLGVLLKKVLSKEFFWKDCNHPIVYGYLLYTVYTGLQIFNPNVVYIPGTLLIIRKFLILILFLYCSIQILNNKKEIIRFFKIWIAVSLVAALYGCYQKWFGMPQYVLDYINSNPLWVSLYSLDTGGFRIFSFLSDPKDFGLLMAASTLIPLTFYLNYKEIKNRPFLLLLVVIYLLAMSYSGTRTSNFMLIMGLILYIMMTILKRSTLIFTGFAAFAFIVILYGPIYGNNTINRIRSTFDLKKEESLQVRDINRHNIQPYIYSHPIGGGLGTTGVLNLENNISHPLAGFPTDSGLLLTALETGWVGLFLQMLLYSIILQQAIKSYYKCREEDFKVFLLIATICLFAYMVAQYAQVAIGQAPGVFLYYSLISIIIRAAQLENTEEPINYP